MADNERYPQELPKGDNSNQRGLFRCNTPKFLDIDFKEQKKSQLEVITQKGLRLNFNSSFIEKSSGDDGDLRPGTAHDASICDELIQPIISQKEEREANMIMHEIKNK